MDRDTTDDSAVLRKSLIRRWEKGEIDILVGTQMITKGHDVSGVTLVGALLADLSLNLPDFRAAERTFQLLSQVAGRSGRGDDPGRVIVQTYAPDHYAIQHLIVMTIKVFSPPRAEFRRALNYPPFGRLVNLRLDGPKRRKWLKSRQESWRLQLRELQAQQARAVREQIEMLGPAAGADRKAAATVIVGSFLLKGKQSSALLEFARRARQLMPPGRAVRLHIDVDPYSML